MEPWMRYGLNWQGEEPQGEPSQMPQGMNLGNLASMLRQPETRETQMPSLADSQKERDRKLAMKFGIAGGLAQLLPFLFGRMR